MPQDGWSELGKMLANGLPTGQSAYVDELRKQGQAAQAMWEARKARSMQIAREGIGPAVNGVYTDPKQAALVTALLGSASSPNMGNLGHFEDPSARALFAERQAALGDGDFKRVNAVTAVLDDKQYEPLDLGAGGKAVFDKVTGETTLTPLGEANMASEAALANQREAAAGAQRAHAGLYDTQAAAGGFSPKTGRTGKYTAPTAANLRAALGDDPEAMADFALWRKRHPEYPVGAQALDAYLAEKSGGGRVKIIDPSLPGSMGESPPSLGDGAISPAQGGLPAPKSKADYDALPSGTRFVAPDGSVRVKP